ncbi:MAG: hypothetical protein A2X86_11230 [Bdellovibrionales bacterium GWA2_49_15]|nr:MAG: hypothetical protein A2X86_11230 [Bdellovibrionales bacterium GWA2_49_15]HAZ12676.1 hypothetical protein [Bdellovibrionales bacterium]
MQKLHDLFHYHFSGQMAEKICNGSSLDDVVKFVISLPKIAALETNLGHVFHDKRLLVTALIHPSLGNEAGVLQKVNYQRLEFLGDSVLSLLLAEKLFLEYPENSEGELSKMRAHLAGQAMVAQLGFGMQLADFLIFGKGTSLQLETTQNPPKGLVRAVADGVEAILGAAFIDAGLLVAKAVFEKFTEAYALTYQKDYLDMATFNEFDPKSRLQEKCLTAYKVLPIYDCRTSDDVLVCDLIINGQLAGQGQGLSKKEAEQNAAREALANMFKS